MKTQAISVFIRLTGAALSLGQTVLLARLLGVAELGVYSAVLAITALLAIPAAAGLPSFLTREISREAVTYNWARIRGLLSATNRVAVIVSIPGIAILVLVFLLGGISGATPSLLVASCALIPLLSFDLVRAGAMRGMGSALASQLPENVLRPGGFLLIVGILGLSGRDLSVLDALLSFGAAAVISTLVGQTLLRRQLRGHREKPDRVKSSEVLRASTGLTLLGGSTTLVANIDIAILSLTGFLVAAGEYRVALLGVVALLIVFNSVADVARRDFAVSIARDDNVAVSSASDRVVVYGSLSAGAVTILYILFGVLGISAIFGAEYVAAYGALVVLSIGHVLAICLGPSLELAMAFQSQRRAVSINVVGVVVTVVTSLVLLPWNPLVGVAIGSASGNVVRRFLLSWHATQVVGFDPSLVGVLRRRR